MLVMRKSYELPPDNAIQLLPHVRRVREEGEQDMTATDDLRRMLDGRGVEWWDSRYGELVVFQVDGVKWFANDSYLNGKLELSAVAVTPEQAIAVTLGTGECHDEGGIGSKYPAAFICSECGWSSTVFAFGGNMPQFCPECGRKVKR